MRTMLRLKYSLALALVFAVCQCERGAGAARMLVGKRQQYAILLTIGAPDGDGRGNGLRAVPPT